MFWRVFGMLGPSPPKWTVIIWLIILVAFAGAAVMPNPNWRIFWLVLGVAALAGRIVANRFME